MKQGAKLTPLSMALAITWEEGKEGGEAFKIKIGIGF